MVNVYATNVEAKWKLNWDYRGWDTQRDLYNQESWNQTLITKINNLSAQIYRISHRGGANTIALNSHVFKILIDHEYMSLSEQDVYVLGGRYSIVLDETLPNNKLYALHANYPKKPIHLPIGNADKEYFWIHSETPNLAEYITKAAANDMIQLTIITPDQLVGEITIENYPPPLVDPVTGSINLSSVSGFTGEDYWIPSPIDNGVHQKGFFEKLKEKLKTKNILK